MTDDQGALFDAPQHEGQAALFGGTYLAADELDELAAAAPHKVSYLHMRGYRVSRRFPNRAAAQEFIDVNALVYPLPGARLERCR